jgi:hypothetical protein
MPREQKWVYTCPITGAQEFQLDDTLPTRWLRVSGDFYSPQGLLIFAHRVIKHPATPYGQLLNAPFPSSTFDDWQ